MEHLPWAIPVFASLNIDAIVAFYQEKVRSNHTKGNDEILDENQNMIKFKERL